VCVEQNDKTRYAGKRAYCLTAVTYCVDAYFTSDLFNKDLSIALCCCDSPGKLKSQQRMLTAPLMPSAISPASLQLYLTRLYLRQSGAQRYASFKNGSIKSGVTTLVGCNVMLIKHHQYVIFTREKKARNGGYIVLYAVFINSDNSRK